MRFRSICLLMIVVVLCTFLRQEALALPNHCRRAVIPLHLGLFSGDFEIVASSLSTEANGTVRGEISLRNKTGRPLSRLTVMVNYLDAKGSILLSIPYQANLPNERNDIENIHPFSELHLNKPLQPGSVIALEGRNLLSIGTDPVSAEVAYWFAKYYDDESSVSTQVGEHGFRTDPLLIETPGDLEVSLPHAMEPIKTFVKLQINEYGRVLEVLQARDSHSELSREQFEDLSKQLSQWHFFPSIENGYAVRSELYMLVEFQPERALPVRHCFLEPPARDVNKFAIVTLQPVLDSRDRWIPYYGGFPAAGKFQLNIIVTGPPAKPIGQ